MKKLMLVLLLAIAAGYGKAFAQQPAVMVSDKTGWHKIAETTVDFQKDRDEVAVIGADKFASIKFKVLDAPIDFKNIEVYFENGASQSVMVEPIKLAGNETRVIDLNGGERSINKIVMVYKTLSNRKDERAHVEIWGLKTNKKGAN